MPITDVLQMMGRAGRPQFDKSGTAVVLVHAPKKPFYSKVICSFLILFNFYLKLN